MNTCTIDALRNFTLMCPTACRQVVVGTRSSPSPSLLRAMGLRKRPAAAAARAEAVKVVKKQTVKETRGQTEPPFSFGIGSRDAGSIQQRLEKGDMDIPLIKICKSMLRKLGSEQLEALMQNIAAAETLTTGSACTGSNVGFVAEHALTALLGVGVMEQMFVCEKAFLELRHYFSS